MSGKTIFHITSRAEEQSARSTGQYVPARFDQDGFIHCSYAHQLMGVADDVFRGQSELVLLEIDREKAGDVRDENLEGGKELYPHIEGTLSMSAVVRVHELPPKEDGTFDLPEAISE